MPSFVILEHDFPHLHWDFMLDEGDALRTWRLSAQPRENQTIRAEALGMHRRLFLHYEGPLSGNRGTVRRWDAGEYDCSEESPGLVRLQLHGTHCQGQVDLVQTSEREWTFRLRNAAEG